MELVFRYIGLAVQLLAVLVFCWGTTKKWYRVALSLLAGCAFVWLISNGFVLGVRSLFGLSLWDFQNRKLFSLVVINEGQILSFVGAWIVRQIRTGYRAAGCRCRCCFQS